jgi:hypothetical protein
MAAYTMDSHNCQRLVVNGMVKNEGNVEIGGFGPYPISYGSIIPKETECKNLFVPVCLSASHIAYGSIRMEPVFMVLAQSSAVAASLAIDANTSVQKVDVAKIQQILKSDPLADGSMPQIIVDNDDSASIEILGSWTTKKHLGFGPSTLIAEKGLANASVKFKPAVTKDGDYSIYAYFLPKYAEISQRIHVLIFDGEKETTVPVDLSKLEAKGQTSGEWIEIGKYKFTAAGKPSVSVTTKGADGLVLADAVLFKPEF